MTNKNEARIRKKVRQLCDEQAKQPLDLRSIAHLSLDLNAAATAELEKRKQRQN